MENIQVRRIGSVFCVSLVIVGLFTSLLSISGCADDSEKAAAEIRKAASKATQDYSATGEYDKAYGKIKGALKTYGSKAGDKAANGQIVAGSISRSQGSKLEATLSQFADDTNALIGKLSGCIVDSILIDAKVAAFDKLVTLADKESSTLKDILEGDSGLNAQLKDQLDKKAQLEKLKADLQSRHDALVDQRTDNQAKIEVKIKAAELTSGDELVKLEDEAYGLVKENNKLHIQIQKLSDEIELTDSKLQLASIIALKYQENVDELKESLSVMSSASGRIDPLKEQLANAKLLAEQQNAKLNAVIEQIKTSVADSQVRAKEAADLYEQAITHYKSVRSRGVSKQIADHELAECYAAVADMYSSVIRRQGHFSLRIMYFTEAGFEAANDVLMSLAGECVKTKDADKQKAYDNYDLAIKGYADLRKATRDSDTACAIAKNQALAFYGKLTLADLLEDFDTSNLINEAKNALIEEIKECDPDYEQSSVVARLFKGDVNYVPTLPIIEVKAPVVEETAPTGDGMGGPGMPGDPMDMMGMPVDPNS